MSGQEKAAGCFYNNASGRVLLSMLEIYDTVDVIKALYVTSDTYSDLGSLALKLFKLQMPSGHGWCARMNNFMCVQTCK